MHVKYANNNAIKQVVQPNI